MSALPLSADPEPSASCSTPFPARAPRPRHGRLGIPEVVVVVGVVLVLTGLVVGNRPVPAALVVAAAVADLIAGRRPNGLSGRPSRCRNR
ncbi:hypothetical protein AB0D27_22655 [Streptomyces sp. NPDC048415]|uniref:hypothetical protein n=1 Tax=Streptomyces sp. NPDC048415 TaxID=3154822 RepID=UPI0034142B07